jgi:hypothetical protein
MKTLLLPACALALALASTACGRSFEAKTPSGYVELEDQDDAGYDYRAVSADGVVVSVRAIDHEPKGELPFWTRVVENHLRQRGGYALLEQRAVKTAGGLAGTQLRFGHDEGSKPHLYYVTVFVTKDHIYVLEAGGTKELMTKNAAELERAVSGFRAK